jgi:hypothetical protein
MSFSTATPGFASLSNKLNVFHLDYGPKQHTIRHAQWVSATSEDWFSCVGVGLVCCSVATPQKTPSEEGTALAALTLSYGPSVDNRRPLFVIAPDYVLAPVFSADDLLIEISIEPKSNSNGQDQQRSIQLSRSDFELNSGEHQLHKAARGV